MKKNAVIITAGDVYGYLTVVEEKERKMLPCGKYERIVLCKCECGKIFTVQLTNLRSRINISCGCRKENKGINFRTHGFTGTDIHNVWRGMIKRTRNNVNYEFYANYYGKGVRVCKEWELDFINFYNWAMSNGYRKGLHLDKDIIPNKLGIPPLLYGPDVCCFVTPLENANTRSNSDFIEYNGELLTLTQIARLHNISQSYLHRKYHKHKLSIEDAIKVVTAGRNKFLKRNERKDTLPPSI